MTIDGKPAIRIGDKVVPVSGFKNGVPVIKAAAIEKPNENGGQDIVVKVPCLQVSSAQSPRGLKK